MQHADAVRLLEGGLTADPLPLAWADLGCGDGVFTRALADLLPGGSHVHAIDRDRHALRNLDRVHPRVTITTHALDLTVDAWPFERVDGILMANALHYVADQPGLLARCRSHLADGGRLVLVEYDTDRADRWVPYPLPRRRALELLENAGFATTRVVGERPSAYRRTVLYALAACLPAAS